MIFKKIQKGNPGHNPLIHTKTYKHQLVLSLVVHFLLYVLMLTGTNTQHEYTFRAI